MKQLSRLQIETAEQVLRNALRDKMCEIQDKAFQKDIAKYTKPMLELKRKAYELYKEASKFKNSVETNKKLSVDIDGYNSAFRNLPTTLAEAMKDNCYVSIGSRNKSYYPDVTKEEKAINEFILGLKLGTALMADMQKLLDVIAKIK